MELQLWKAAVLGAVQGLTEFLPISSSGHLALTERWLGASQLPFSFDIFVHLGTMAALLFFFRHQLVHLSRKYFVEIVVATLPAVVFGLLLKSRLESVEAGGASLAFSFLISAFFMFVADRLLAQEDASGLSRLWEGVSQALVKMAETLRVRFTLPAPNSLQAFLIGLFQALAILPGVSRSGSTLFGGLLVGLPRTAAFEFAFIISIPAVLGALVLDLADMVTSGGNGGLPFVFTALATVTAAVFGFAALRLLEYTIQHSRLKFFAWYLVLVSIATVLFV